MSNLNGEYSVDDHFSTEAISLALDGLLDPEEQRRFDRHIQACAACNARRSEWRNIGRLLQHEPFVGPASGFALRVDRRLRAQQIRRERLLGRAVLIGGTVSVWGVLFLGLVLTTVVWLLTSPAALYQGLDALAFAGQIIGLLLRQLSAMRNALLGAFPGSALAIGVYLMILAGLWVRLATRGGSQATPSLAAATSQVAARSGDYDTALDQRRSP